jgi:para-nitrobenzyl esterase|tara:strand:- start:33079 stop:34545 length:1467 start_codon:yes stop_codon:yes gene_type:complete
MQLTVDTQQGPVEGRSREGAILFAGIPYASPPVGILRFAPPAPPVQRANLLEAKEFGPASPQLPGDGLTDSHEVNWNEDCLTLNICTPSPDQTKRPVMVWIHGGAYRHGTGSIPWYDGTRFAKESKIVTVTINYRLGALGFAKIPGAPTSGINGILDQIAALKWVQDNIENFGGDPNNVTIAGESAGAFSVATIMAMEESSGLFHKAIAQSGAGHHVISKQEAQSVGKMFMEKISATSLEEAQEQDVQKLLHAQKYVEDNAHKIIEKGQLPFYPSITKGHLENYPITLFSEGASSNIPVLTGTNTDETTLWGTNQIPESKLEKWLKNYVANPEQFISAVKEDRGDISAGDIALAISTDHAFRIPAIRMAEARANHGGQTWMYEFDWKSKAFNGMLGSCHALEIPFAFGTLGVNGTDVFLGTTELPHELEDTMHTSWAAFITTGKPETNRLSNWPIYSSKSRSVMRFAENTELINDPWPSARKSWEGIR